jgi:Amt family ammonium transporter
MSDVFLINNLWIILAALLVFLMTVAVGMLEVGELGKRYSQSFLKTLMISGFSLFFMAFLGFDIAFAPTLGGVIGNPLYNGIFLGGFSTSVSGILSGSWWSMGADYFNTGLTTGTYFLFETAFAAVTLAIVGVIALRKVKLGAFLAYSVVYLIIIWTLPAAWIWNPTGWLYQLGARDFGGGLVVHGAAGIAGLAMVTSIWREEKRNNYPASPQVKTNLSSGWLTLSVLLLWIGWFGFNAGSVLAFNSEVTVVALNTFLSAGACLVSTMGIKYLMTRENPGFLYAANGIIMGLILMSPLSGYISPGMAALIGLLGGPLFLAGEKIFTRKWFSDPIGLFPTHLLGGITGFLLIAFVSQSAFAAASGAAGLPNGLLFGGGMNALRQIGINVLSVVVVGAFVYAATYASMWVIGKLLHGITTDYSREFPEDETLLSRRTTGGSGKPSYHGGK